MTDGGQALPREAEVVVIGAGLLGCSIAYQLAKRGKQVLVVERRGICSGASGRNGSLTGSGTSLPSTGGAAAYALTSENLRMLRDELPRELDDDFALRLPGSLDLATDAAEYEHLVASVALEQANGQDVALLDVADLRALLPIVSDRVLGARLARGNGHLWPFQLVHALAAGARRYGARIVTETPVTCIVGSAEAVEAIETARGRVEAGSVVLATNGWTSSLLDDLPPGALVPTRGQILVTEPAPPILRHPFNTNFDKEYGRQTTTGQILCGGYRRLDQHEGIGLIEEHVTATVVEGIAGCLTSLFPSLGSLHVVRAWAGIMGFTADGLPLLGAYGDRSGLYVAAGFNGTGFSWGAAVGKALAQLVCYGRAAFDLEPFDPNRFTRGDVVWANPFTAGERNNPGKLSAGPGA